MDQLKDSVRNIIHEGKQIPDSEKAIILTVKAIGRLSEAGALDFGGSEYSQAGLEWIEPEKANPDDDYGWWDLPGGTYIVEYNEVVDPAKDSACHFQIWPPALYNGLSHPSELIGAPRDPLRSCLTVSAVGVRIKENARLSIVTTP